MSELIFSQTKLSVRRLCELAQLSRSNYYRALKRPPHRKAEVESELSKQVEERTSTTDVSTNGKGSESKSGTLREPGNLSEKVSSSHRILRAESDR